VAGEVVSSSIKTGDPVTHTTSIAIVLSMKMEREVPAFVTGTVVALGPELKPGSSVAEGQPLVLVELAVASRNAPTGHRLASPLSSSSASEGRLRPDLAEVLQRRQVTQHQWRAANDPKFAARREDRHIRGQLTARELVARLADRTWSEQQGIGSTFREIGRFVVAAQLGRRKKADLIRNTPADGLVSGIAHCNRHLFGAASSTGTRTALLAYDYTVLAGTQGAWNHQKI